MNQRKPPIYRVYFKTTFVSRYGERSAPARDFAVAEAKETADVSCILQGFLCAQMQRKIRRKNEKTPCRQ